MSYTHLTCICIRGQLNAGFELFGHGHSHIATLLRCGSWEPGWDPSSKQTVCVCAYTASADQALLLSRKCKLLQEEKKRRMLKTMEKSLSLFLQAEFCCYFVQQVLFVR